MFNGSVDRIWCRSRVLREAFEEYRTGLKDVYSKAAKILKPPVDTPEEFRAGIDEIPKEFFCLRKNIFSTLFQSVYHLLGVRKERRILYGKLNHLFRIWVTSADNLLDKEDKIVLPLRISADSHTMRQVISLMAADRILKQLLDEAVERKVVSFEDAKALSEKSLQVLLPSAAEEASEEKGISRRPKPEYVLYTIHRLKTEILFHLPFLGPETVEGGIDAELIKKTKDALGRFGLGCQLLDDIRDMAKDYLEKRHNYLLSMMHWGGRNFYKEQLAGLEGQIGLEAKIFLAFPGVVYPAAELAKDFLRAGLSALEGFGLGAGRQVIEMMVLSMFEILGVGELIECLDVNKKITDGGLLPQGGRSIT